MDKRAIGVFDSGLGGLTAIPYLHARLPQEKLIYFGDTARTPYGSKTLATIRQFSTEIVSFLASKGVKMVVIACNTVTSTALDTLRERFPDIDFVGIIDPMAEALKLELPELKQIAVIGTKVTIESDVYAKSLKRLFPEAEVLQKACPIFVPLIEEGFADSEMMDLAIHHYLDDWIRAHHIQDLILGCTHYPLIAPRIEAAYPNLRLHNPSEMVVRRVIEELEAKDALAPPEERPEPIFYASDLSENFRRMIDSILGEETGHLRFKNLDR